MPRRIVAGQRYYGLPKAGERRPFSCYSMQAPIFMPRTTVAGRHFRGLSTRAMRPLSICYAKGVPSADAKGTCLTLRGRSVTGEDKVEHMQPTPH